MNDVGKYSNLSMTFVFVYFLPAGGQGISPIHLEVLKSNYSPSCWLPDTIGLLLAGKMKIDLAAGI